LKTRPLNKKLTSILLIFAVPAVAIIILISGVLEYNSVMESMARAVRARLGVAADLVRDRILCNSIVDDIKKEAIPLIDRGASVYEPDPKNQRCGNILWYCLDETGRVILIPKKYRLYLGIDFSAIFHRGTEPSTYHYQSILTKHSVVGIACPINHRYTLVIERDLVDIIPSIKYFTRNPIFPQEVIFLLSGSGRAVYHPDESVVKTRANLAFSMKERNKPDHYGFFRYTHEGRKFIAMSMSFAVPAQWRIYYSLPAEVIQHNLEKTLLINLSMLLLLMGFTFLLLHYLLSRVFSRPVGNIVHAVETGHTDRVNTLDRRMAGGIAELESILKAVETRDIAVAQVTEQLNAILNSIDASVYVADMETYELLFINDRIKRWAGDVIGKKCFEALQPNQKRPCPFCTNRMLVNAQGEPAGVYLWEYENQVTGKWYECRDRAIPWTDGRLVRIEISTDITWRKETEKEIFNEKERLAVTLASIGDAVITTDTEAIITLMNPAAEKITGWPANDAMGKAFEEVVKLQNQRTGNRCSNPVERALITGDVTVLENSCCLVRRDGTTCTIADCAAPIFDRGKKIIGAVVVFRDITEELRTQKELLKIKKLETVGVLAGGIAHDFNNIIAAIMGYIELAQFELNPSEKPYRQLDHAIKACGRAKDLAQQLLTFSKGGTPVKKRTSLPELIRESADFVLHGSTAVCKYRFAHDLWMADVDRGQLSQVIQNLVLNSIHAMQGGGTIWIRCSNCNDPKVIAHAGLPAGRYVKIEIEDTGSGIPEEIIDKIFEPYFSTRNTGNGLGLSIVHSIISKHNGAIKVRSEKGRGAVFTILLPAAEESTQEDREIPYSLKDAATEPATILVMDDDPTIRTLASDLLKIYGHRTIEARDGREAMEIFKKMRASGRHVDLFIMDLTVPGGMGGVEALQKLLEMDPDVRAVVASGYANDPVMTNFHKYGFKGALVKPYTLKELGDLIVRLQIRGRTKQ